ncbi:hypothetical protein CW751_14175 [Brumimicrobium salinarum]|uniref:Secretion system C-terminal sorting domain-containing protein n=1 Tax=Brumimicrobium salinarum TaxID=2058658 RepID=A0A2I0QZ73_9FLAO|nr:T9SS type A sorting domain-containing protein [Brumimicrobium salinarum]PKR79634.1 hypothetical protein CW751_14175 [Brumimicrobium salinarum]
MNNFLLISTLLLTSSLLMAQQAVDIGYLEHYNSDTNNVILKEQGIGYNNFGLSYKKIDTIQISASNYENMQPTDTISTLVISDIDFNNFHQTVYYLNNCDTTVFNDSICGYIKKSHTTYHIDGYLEFYIRGSYDYQRLDIKVIIDTNSVNEPNDNTSSIKNNKINVTNTKLYPNPVTDVLNIEFDTDNTDMPIELYSTNGQLLDSNVDYRSTFDSNKVTFNMRQYSKGLYLIKLGDTTKKVLKR